MLQRLMIKNYAGFTLIEVLVAVIILGVSVTVILEQFSVALRAGSMSKSSTRAVLYAKQKLEDLRLKNELSESSESGTFDDGYTWETEVIQYQNDTENNDTESYEELKVETFQLKATVMWRDGTRQRKVVLTTLKTVRKKQWM